MANGIQAFYTKSVVANSIFSYLNLTKVNNILDIGAGAGSLSNGIVYGSQKRKSTPQIYNVDVIEPENNTFKKVNKVYNMTLEEYVISFAKPDSYDTVISNPPFGKRIGRTKLGEQINDLHRPDLNRFESYFLSVAADIATDNIVFIVPRSYLDTDEYRNVIISELSRKGWYARLIADLPIDSFESAIVNTALLVLIRNHKGVIEGEFDHNMIPHGGMYTIYDAMKLAKYTTDGIPSNVIETKKGRFGDVTGTITLPEKSLPSAEYTDLYSSWHDPASGFHYLHPFEIMFNNAMQTPRLPHSLPCHALGSTMVRLGVHHTLTNSGWEATNSGEWVDGLPADKQFKIARLAYTALMANAKNTAQTIARNLDITSLFMKYGSISSASFLYILRGLSKDKVKNYLQKDLDFNGGAVRIASLLNVDKLPANCHVAGEWIYTDDMNDTVAFNIYLELTGDEEVGFVENNYQHLYDIVSSRASGYSIPLEELNIRETWIPNQVFTTLSKITINENGFYFTHVDQYYISGAMQLKAVCAWLNYGKGPFRITDDTLDHVKDFSTKLEIKLESHTDPTNITQMGVLCVASYVAATTESSKRNTVELALPKSKLKFHNWQLNAVQDVNKGIRILGWGTGIGKTGAGIAIATAWPGQTLFVVPKDVIRKWYKDIKKFYPRTRIGLIGFKIVNDKLVRTAGSEVANDLYQCFFDDRPSILLTSHQVFVRNIPSSDESFRTYTTEEAYTRHSNNNKFDESNREKYILSATRRKFAHGGDIVFDDLPLSGLSVIVDEAHRFKGLNEMPTRGWDDQLIMTGQCGTSKGALDVYVKSRILTANGGRMIGATATFAKNSPIDLYNMLSIFNRKALTDRGINTPQQYIDKFCIFEGVSSITIQGELVNGNKIIGFKDLDVHSAIVKESISIITPNDVDLYLPDVEEYELVINPNTKQASALRQVRQEVDDAIISGEPMHIFEVISKLDKLTNVPQLVDSSIENSKLDKLVEVVLDLYSTGKKKQLIFADYKDYHVAINDALVKAGIPQRRIRIVNGDTSSNDLSALQDDYLSNKLHIVIGGQMASEGVDLQHNTSAIHIAQMPWEGQMLVQRKGRGVRQGNKTDVVGVYYYILSGSADPYRWSMIKSKTHWLDSLISSSGKEVSATVMSDAIDMELLASIANDEEAITELLRDRATKSSTEKMVSNINKSSMSVLRALSPIKLARKGGQENLNHHLNKLHGFCKEADIDYNEVITRVKYVSECIVANVDYLLRQQSDGKFTYDYLLRQEYKVFARTRNNWEEPVKSGYSWYDSYANVTYLYPEELLRIKYDSKYTYGDVKTTVEYSIYWHIQSKDAHVLPADKFLVAPIGHSNGSY